MDPSDEMVARYDALWSAAAPEVRAGRATLDARALHKEDDARRGITLLARPAPAAADRLSALVRRLGAIEPAQYEQPRSDLHLTVLSLFTATADVAPHLARLAAYRAAVAEAVAGVPPFEVELRGVTLSSGAVLAQGFPRDATLARLRERLRGALAARGVGGGLDERYQLVTAHLTLVRFTTPLRDPARYVDALAAARDEAFGTWRVERLELVLGDWYQSSDRARPLAAYELAAGG